ncbi:hypothetical protein BD779DRAFT_1457355 [Infundibulicybe gibba]|nr:hypothetical protein BD779DRAFT_1457355 [Infundibulicybe gibba]
MRAPYIVWLIWLIYAGTSGVSAMSTEDPFPMISFKVLNVFVNDNFSSKISLATVMMVLFTLMDNPELLNLHIRQLTPTQHGQRRVQVSGWMRSLARQVQIRLGSETKRLFKSSESYSQLGEDDQIITLAIKLDTLAEVLLPRTVQKKLQPISYDAIQSVRTICPSSVACEDLKCKPYNLLQATKPRDIPIVTLIEGSKIHQDVAVLAGKCPKCNTLYYADHERFTIGQNAYRAYLNSARYLKIGQTMWVDRIFSNAVVSGMYSFHASASAYTEFWNHSFGSIQSQDNPMITRRQVWQAFVQESIRSIASMSGFNLELNDSLSIDEVTVEAFANLGQGGQIKPANGHACSECTQEYKGRPGFIPQQDPAAVVGIDENQPVPSLNIQHEASVAGVNSDYQEDDDMDVDMAHAPVKMILSTVHLMVVQQIWKTLVEGHFVHIIILNLGHAVVCVIAIVKFPSRFYCVETICAPCGAVIAWTKFDKSESPTKILQFLEEVYPTEDSRPAYICIDKACLVLKTSIANRSWDMWKRTSRFVVDSYHYVNHRTTDRVCRKWCNPAPLDGSAPNLVVVAQDNQGRLYYKRAFNTQACEQLNAWLGGFESILKRLTPGNFNWFLHVMLFYHTRYVIERQKQRQKQSSSGLDNNESDNS